VKGVLYFELLKLKETVTSERYQQQLMRLSDEIGRKRSYTGQETHQAILLHDNAQLNDSNQRIYILIYILIWEILYHG